MQPIPVEEIESLRNIYFAGMTLASVVDGDETAASTWQSKITDLSIQESQTRDEGTTHLLTFCGEVQDVVEGDSARNDDDALDHYNAALETNAEYVPALLGAGQVLFGQGDVQAARDKAEEATRAAPANASAWADLALYRLASGDKAGANDAYQHFFNLVSQQGPQHQMASILTVLEQLDTQLKAHSDFAPLVLSILPRFASYLDEMASDGEGNYQYAALYTTLGNVSLRAGDPRQAEAWLRHAIDLDAHQPQAHADLVVAVVAQGGDGSEEMEHALIESRDPLWASTVDFTADRVLSMLDSEVSSLQDLFPQQESQINEFLGLIASEQDRLRSP